MEGITRIPRTPNMPEEADFAVTLREEDTVPVIAVGETVFVSRTGTLADGDVGIFQYRGKMLCRQVCQDSFGTVYLLALNPAFASEDLILPAHKQDGLLCFGKVLLSHPPALPDR